jgi:hypothetical protein
MSIRIRFDAQITTKSNKGEFPPDTIAAVYVTNRDGCTYQCAPVSGKGAMAVNFRMEPTKSNVKLTDRIKFHFYFRDNKDNMLKPVCAGHMTMLELADMLKDGAHVEIGSNFNTNTVRMSLQSNHEASRDMHVDLLQLYKSEAITKSVLIDSPSSLKSCQKLDECIHKGLDNHTIVAPDNGGPMFQSVFTAHMMENECTLYTLYHLDFNEPENVPPWLATYMLTETLHHNAMTIEQVKGLPLKGLTDFIASYAQGPMRSASAVPYTSDMTLNEDPTEYIKSRSMLSEVFKRPYSHPHAVLEGRGTLQTDDCEGLVVMLQNLTNHLAYMYETHLEDFKQTNAYLPYNNLMKRYFPRDLFTGMSTQYQNKLMDLAFMLGEHVSKKTIECKVTLVSANAASMGGVGKREVQGHACASLVCNDPNSHHVVMMEGTACTTDDQDSRRLRVGKRFVTVAEVANALSGTPPFNQFMESNLKTRIAVHLTHSHGSFYRTAFCQNDSVLGSQIGHGKLMFGVDMEYLGDESVKVYMPVQGTDLAPGEYDKLKKYVQDRRVEIHPPLVDHDELRESLKWHPIGPFKGCKELQQGRPYTTCLVHVLADERNSVESLVARVNAEVEKFNSDPGLTKLGVMRVFPSMDGVSKVLHLYSDDTDELSARLNHMIEVAKQQREAAQKNKSETVTAS